MSVYFWSNFGVLANVSADKRMLIITNETGSTRQMSIVKYKESAEAVYHKCFPLIGQSVDIQTSQNTAEWSPQEWFSDISSSRNK
ncbi:hypothetical protein [Aeromonas piscicola]|uniref:hypothetical protein n=1 Tax=Aeromonas piscicola TaxID=600645 RepID=UPI0028E2936B|nr:hypothetical protein [Aeromonas piscicola]